MAIVLLTDHPWPQVDLERSILEPAGHVLIAGPQQTPPVEIVEALIEEHDPQVIMTCWALVSKRAIDRPSQLRHVQRMGVGLDNIDVPAATARGAWVANVPDYCMEEVSDHAVALLLSLWRGTAALDRAVKQGEWNPGATGLRRVTGSTVGIIGYGRIGQLTATKLHGLGCKVLANSRTLLSEHAVGVELSPGVSVADLPAMQAQADAILILAPLTPATQRLIDDGFLRGLRRKPVIINVSRGGIIATDALVRALDAGLVSGAGLDVVEGEPTPPSSITQRADVIMTPHIAFSSAASMEELRRRCCEEIVRVLRGERPRHPCNQPLS
jgi:D-3-phosphoglycerate dehydrogenase